jgi:SAM-dependent methyltransferase
MMVTLDLDALDLKDGQRVLDLGCGRGRHSHAFYWHDKALDVTMLDLSLEDLKGAIDGFFELPPAAPGTAAQRGLVRWRRGPPALCRQQL